MFSSEAADLVRSLVDGEHALSNSSHKGHWTGKEKENETVEPEAVFDANIFDANRFDADFDTPFNDASAESELTGLPFELSASDDLHAVPANADENSYASNEAADSIPRNWADLQVTLRFHRADLYLGLAVFVALLALLWPAASVPKRAALGPWQRALIHLGIAEAPAPVIHLQGDPGVQVWVDPHTALYYCPGSDAYGKTTDGRFSSQRDAQLDRFEPAARSVCE